MQNESLDPAHKILAVISSIQTIPTHTHTYRDSHIQETMSEQSRSEKKQGGGFFSQFKHTCGGTRAYLIKNESLKCRLLLERNTEHAIACSSEKAKHPHPGCVKGERF